MLQNYAVSNFQSFRERFEVDLTLNRKASAQDWVVETSTGERVSTLMAVIGPNGSGKTALLKPLVFLGWFTAHSFQETPDAEIPLTPHFSALNEATEFECLVDFDGRLWRYVLRCTPQRVLHEALYQKRDRFSYVFIRDWDESNNNYRVKQQDFGLVSQEARKVRSNTSLISTAAQYGVPLARRMAATHIATNVNIQGRMPFGERAVLSAAEHFATQPEQYQQMNRLLSAWDLGLSGIELRPIESPTLDDPDRKIWLPFGKHKTKKTKYSLPFAAESNGTRSAFVLLSRLLPVLKTGGLAIIDEFESDLHPHMLEPILDLFANPLTNPYRAQLLFTCHALEILNLVHKSQIMLVEKNADCESSACRLDAVSGIRNDDNFYAKYMAGAYGAVPNF